MSWMPPTRNFDGVQFESLRRAVDDKFNDVHDRLSTAYYNAKCGWDGPKVFAQGDVTIDFETLIKQDSASAKGVFDKYHGLIHHLREKAFHAQNLLQPQTGRISLDEYYYLRDAEGKVVDNVVDAAQRYIDTMKFEGIELVVS